MTCGALLSACAFAPRLVQLEPLPPRPRLQPATGCLQVAAFRDKRERRDRVGSNHAGLAKAVTYGDVPAWIQGHLARSLAPLSTCTPGQTPAILHGAVETAYVDEGFTLDGEITVFVEFSVGGQQLLARRFTGEYSRVSHAASSEEYTITLYESLLDLDARLSPTIAHALMTSPLRTGAAATATPAVGP